MRKIVINRCWGGFGLSEKAMEIMRARLSDLELYDRDIARDDKSLIEVVETLGQKSWGDFAKLKIVKIPEDVEWEIDEYDGMETVREVSRSWS